MTTRFFLPLLLAASMAACATSTPLPATPPASGAAASPTAPAAALAGLWALAEAPGLPAVPEGIRLVLRNAPPREGGQATLDVSGFAGVNHYRGQATLNADQQQLVTGPLAATRMAGPDAAMRFEAAYLQQLEKVGRYEWRGSDTLVLRTLGGESLVFSRKGP